MPGVGVQVARNSRSSPFGISVHALRNRRFKSFRKTQQESTAALSRRMKRYTLPRLLCIDEVDYLSYDCRFADLLFEAVTRRYDAERAIVSTTNKPFAE